MRANFTPIGQSGLNSLFLKPFGGGVFTAVEVGLWAGVISAVVRFLVPIARPIRYTFSSAMGDIVQVRI